MTCSILSYHSITFHFITFTLCAGGRGVASVCRALAVNYKKFSSGTPDLLLIRVSRPRNRYTIANTTSGKVAVDAEDVAGEREVAGEGEGGGGRVGPPQCLGVADILGSTWDVLIDAGDDSSDTLDASLSSKADDQVKKDQDDEECDAEANITITTTSILTYKEEKSSAKTKGRYNKWRKRKTKDDDNEDLQSLGRTKKEVAVADAGRLSGKASAKMPAVGLFQTLKRRHVESSVVVDMRATSDADEVEESDCYSVPLSAAPMEEDGLPSDTVGEKDGLPSHSVGEDAAERTEDDRAYDRFCCSLADLVLPGRDSGSNCDGSSQSRDDSHNQDVTAITGDVDHIKSESEPLPQTRSMQSESRQVRSSGSEYEGWRYECMMVEVKGPTDSLADHQLMWLCVLSSSGVATFVAHVKETSLIE